MTEGSDTCALCPLDREAHEDPDIRHEFSADGQLRRKQPPAMPMPPPPSAKVVIVPDIALRQLMIDKGFITEDELFAAEVYVHGNRQREEAPSDGSSLG